MINPKNILRLTLCKNPFDTMAEGLKDREYREPSKWIKTRLINSETGQPKKYDAVLFSNGYSTKSPYMLFKYKGFEIAKKNYLVEYKNGFAVSVKKGQFRIILGTLIQKGNIDIKQLF